MEQQDANDSELSALAQAGVLTAEIVLTRSRKTELEDITKLNCCGNQISSLKDFSHCIHLKELLIRNNQVRDLEEICHLKPLEKLRVLWMSDNPCTNEDNYRYTVLKNLPNLERFDNKFVTEDELKNASHTGRKLETPKKPQAAKRLKVGNTSGCHGNHASLSHNEIKSQVPSLQATVGDLTAPIGGDAAIMERSLRVILDHLVTLDEVRLLIVKDAINARLDEQ